MSAETPESDDIGMTIENYARFRRVDVSAVRQALKAGQLTTMLDGKIDPAHPPIGLTPPQYAAHRARNNLRGQSRQMVHKAIEAGWVVTYVDGTINPEASDTRWGEKSGFYMDSEKKSHSQASTPAPSPTEPTPGPDPVKYYKISRAMREKAEAEIARMNADEQAGKIVTRAAIDQKWSEIALIIRTHIMGMPDRLSSQLASISDPKIIRNVIDAECRAALNAAADAMNSTGDDTEDDEG